MNNSKFTSQGKNIPKNQSHLHVNQKEKCSSSSKSIQNLSVLMNKQVQFDQPKININSSKYEKYDMYDKYNEKLNNQIFKNDVGNLSKVSNNSIFPYPKQSQIDSKNMFLCKIETNKEKSIIEPKSKRPPPMKFNDFKDAIISSMTSNMNNMSLGTKIMMDNERTHAYEAIESGIYVTWNCIDQSPEIECFRIGSKSKCICGHDFPSHEKVVTSKKFSTKCEDCSCKSFRFIPQLPEEVGEYWLPRRKDFNYLEWKAKCKCKHTWEDHDINKKLKCGQCSNCPSFFSAFCCVVCNKFWHQHEVNYELKKERIQKKKPVDEDFLPFNEMPEISNVLFPIIDSSRLKKIC